MDWFLYDNDLHHERVKTNAKELYLPHILVFLVLAFCTPILHLATFQFVSILYSLCWNQRILSYRRKQKKTTDEKLTKKLQLSVMILSLNVVVL